MSTLQTAAELPDSSYGSQLRQVLGVRYELALRKVSGYTDCTLVEDVDTAFISKITDGNFSGAKIVHSSIRKYETSYAAHILGTVGPLYAEDLENPMYADYPRNATVGKSGVESAFESYLRGKNGRRVISTNSDGKITGEYYSVEPQPGNTVELTIDLELQKAVEDALAETITAMNAKDGLVERGAGAVVERIGTGEILALASYPTYDLSTFRQSEIWAELSGNPAKPFTNRATQGTYPPGSTFKMLTAAAALEEGVVGLKEEVRDTGYWVYPDLVEGTRRWGYWCWNHAGHGKVDVVKAITVSCNYFFYEMGYRLGIDRLSDWAARFGFGEPTGIEIGDASGILASREEREERGGVWYGGDTVMAAIGQSDNLFTPIQLANYVATLVNGGTRYQPHLLKTVMDYTNTEVYEEVQPTVLNTIEISSSSLNAIKEGMKGVVTEDGTASSYFAGFPIQVGGKTGSAQMVGHSATGVFVSFAPYDQPEIAVCVVGEYASSGGSLAPVAIAAYDQYFGLGLDAAE
jgi:penicillin-binding protein 2